MCKNDRNENQMLKISSVISLQSDTGSPYKKLILLRPFIKN